MLLYFERHYYQTSVVSATDAILTQVKERKDELKNTSIIITCYDRDGKEVKRVTSADDGIVENNEDNGDDNGVDNGVDNGSNGGSTQNGGNTGNGGTDNGGGTDTGGGGGGNNDAPLDEG